MMHHLHPSDIVKARYLEAADTDRRLPVRGFGCGGFWPAYQHTWEDMAGWGEKRLAEHRREMWSGDRIPPSSAAIQRHEEVMDWTGRYLDQEDRRHLVWAWAFSIVGGKSFSAWARKKGLARRTAYNRLEAAIGKIAASIGNDGVLLTLPDEKWMAQVSLRSGIENLSLDESAPTPRAIILPGGEAADLLKSPADLKAFEKHLAAVNDERRRLQAKIAERRKRKLLGIEAA